MRVWSQALYFLFGQVPAFRSYFIATRADHASHWDMLNNSLDAVSKGEALDIESLFERLGSRTDSRGRCKSHVAQNTPFGLSWLFKDLGSYGSLIWECLMDLNTTLQQHPDPLITTQDDKLLKLLCYCSGRVLEHYVSAARQLYTRSSFVGTCSRTGDLIRLSMDRGYSRIRFYELHHPYQPQMHSGLSEFMTTEPEERMLHYLGCLGRAIEDLFGEDTMLHLYNSCEEGFSGNYESVYSSLRKSLRRSILARALLFLYRWSGPNSVKPEYPRGPGDHDASSHMHSPVSLHSSDHVEKIMRHIPQVSFRFGTEQTRTKHPRLALHEGIRLNDASL